MQGRLGQDSALSWTKKPFPGGVCWDNYKQLYNAVAAWDDGQLLGLIQKLKGKWDAQRDSESCHIPGCQPHMLWGWTLPHGRPEHLPRAEPEALCGRKFFRKWKTCYKTLSLISSQPAAWPWGATLALLNVSISWLDWTCVCGGPYMFRWKSVCVREHECGCSWMDFRWTKMAQKLPNVCMHICTFSSGVWWFHHIEEWVTQKSYEWLTRSALWQAFYSSEFEGKI